jgi:hypothetical protein
MIASLDSVKRLNKVDFPTFGRPTIATMLLIVIINLEYKDTTNQRNNKKKGC